MRTLDTVTMRLPFFSLALRFGALAALALAPACEGRSSIPMPPPLPPGPICKVAADCPGYADMCKPVTCDFVATVAPVPGVSGIEGAYHCVAGTPVDCNDNDPCTIDTCEPSNGTCFYTHATPDNDGDGYYAPLPGFAPGSPGSCGDDCDDTNPNAHPGGVEVCDGVDNDCDGIIDNGAVYLPEGAPQVRVNGDNAPATPGGLGWSGTSYASSYTGDDNGFDVYVSELNPLGGVITPPGEQQITLTNADAEGAPITWNGDRYGMVWQDRRTGSYQVYFTTLDPSGRKEIADRQITFNDSFSVNPVIAWNNAQFVVAWQDDRNGPFDVFVQFVNADGSFSGPNMQVTQAVQTQLATLDNESPSIAPGIGGIGMAWSFGDSLQEQVDFQVFTPDFKTPVSQPIAVTNGSTEAVYPMVVWNMDRYIVAWYDNTADPKAIYAASYSATGELITPVTAITSPGAFQSRYPFLRALGDRILVVYADDRDQNDGYEIYTRMIYPNLTPLLGELRVTDAPGDSVHPYAAFGPDGNFGILFRDDREAGQQNVFFTSLTCYMPPKADAGAGDAGGDDGGP